MSNNIINHINNSLDTDEKLKSFFGWNKQYNDYKNNQQTAFNENYNNASWIEKRAIEAGQTFNDILGSLLAGALKQTEGIYDAGAQLASVVTGKMGNKELSKSILESLKKDATQTTLSMFDLDNNSKSWVNNIPGKAPDIIRGVGQGVGQVGMTAAFAKLGGKTAATAALFLGAYGNSLESSLNEGASMKDATVYSTLSAGVELFTERMFGGVSGKFLGNGMLDKYVNKYASSTLAKLAMDAAGEGFEEAFAEAVQPFLKMTYNDKDIKETWNDATSGQQFEQILDSAIVGALTSVAFGGATGQYTAKSMAESSVSEIKAIEKQQSNLYKNNTLTEQKLSSIDGSIQYHLKTFNKQLNRIETVEDKLKYIKDMGMESYYDENAKLREVNTSERSAMNFTAFKSSKRIEGLKLAKEVSEAQSNVLRLGEKLGKKVVVAETEDGINGYFDPDTQTIVVSSKATNPTEVFVHELTHKLEGTEQYSNYVRYLINAIENNDNLKSKVLGNRITLEAIENAYKGQINGMDKKSKDYVVLTEFVAKATSEALFTDSKSIERLVSTDKNIAEKIYDWIKAQVKKIKNPSTPEERAYLSMLKKAEKLYSDAIENEVGGVRLSDISGASNENNRFSRADLRIASIQKAFANQLLNSESVFLDFTPIFLQKLGLNNDVLTITQNHLAKIVKAPKDSYNGEHAIPLVYIEKQLIEDLNDPMLAFDLGNNKVGIMSDYLDVDGSPVYIPIKYSVTSIVNNVTIDSNHITSIYGRDAFAQYINQNFSKIIYINKQKTRALFSSSGNIYPNQLNALVDKTILQQVGNNVNINDKVQDSEGDLLSNEQIDFFKNSKVRDKKGNLKVLFHGTNSPDFTVFNKNKISSNFPNNPKTGFFFTDKRDSARYYAGNNGIIKEVYLNLENPLIIKVKDNTPTASIYYSNNAVQIASDISKGNHDGAIIMHKHRNLYIALESNQIKNTTNLKPTSNDDIRLSIDSRGVELTKEQQEFFKDSKVLDVDGNLLVVYHGTKNIEFNEFDGSTVRKDNMLGKGFYFSTSNEIASKYGNRTITAYLNIKNPFKTNSKFPYFGSSLSRVFTDAELKPYINQKSGTVKPESINNLLMAKGYDGIMTDGGLIVAFESNQIKLVTNRKPTDNADIRLSKTIEDADSWDDPTIDKIVNDLDDIDFESLLIESELMSDVELSKVEEATVKPQRIKNSRPNKMNPYDFSRPKYDSLRTELTPLQKSFYKNTKLLTKNGELPVVYHGSKAKFDVFDKTKVGSSQGSTRGQGFYFTPNPKFAEQFGDVRAFYLKAERPYVIDSEYLSRTRLNAKHLIERYNIAHISMDYIMEKVNGGHIFDLLDVIKRWTKSKGTFDFKYDTDVLKDLGFDSVVDNDQFVVFDENQMKLIENINPTDDKNIRYSINGTYTKQQVNKIIANRVNQKYYNRADAEVVINTALTDIIKVPEGKVTISNKNFEQVVRELWDVLNTKQPGNRLGYALQIAEYIVDNAYAQKMIDTSADRKNLELLATLNQYKKRIDLEAITQELNTALGNNKQPFNTWGKRSTTTEFLSMDQVVSELKANGIELKGANAVEMFIDLNKMYTDATKEVKRQINAIKNELTKEERHDAIQEITRNIMNAFETKGKVSSFKKQLNSYISKINVLREQLDKAYKVNRAVNNLLATINKVEGLEKYRSVELYPLSMEIVSGIKTLKKVRTWRGNLNNANAVRELFKKYSTKVVDIEGKMIPLYEIYHRINNGETFDTPFGDMIDAIAAGEGELSLEEIKAIDAILLNFIHNVKNQDTIFFQNRSQSETEVATRAIEETKQAVPIAQSGWKYGLGKYTRWLQAPYWRMRRLSNYNNSGYFSQMFNEFKDGFSKQAGFKMTVVKHFEEFFKAHKDVVSKWREPIMIEFDRTMSKGQIISLILTSKRKQAKMHLFNTSTGQGTIRLSNEKLASKKRMKDALLQGQDMSINEAFIERLESQLNDTDKAFIKLADEFFNDISKKAKIETDNAIFGVSNVVDDNYFPLKVADDQIYKQLGDNEMDFKNLFSVYNASFNKAVRKNANNKVVIENVLDVINRHTEQMASYYGLAIPMKTFNRVWNKKTDLSEKLMVEVQKVDPEFQSYMVKLFKDMQGVGIERDGFDKFLSKVRGWSARAALGANPKVLATQFASLFSAHAVGFKYASLLKGLSMGFARKTDYETLYKYSPILYDRAREGNNIDVGLLKEGTGVLGKIDNLTNLTTKPIGMIDNLVVGSVWNAALDQLKEKYSGEELYREAALMTEKAVIVTQANYSPLFRPSILRTQSSALQLVTMFMSEPLQLYSQISGAIDMIKTAKANLKNGKIDKTEAQKQVDEAYKQAKTIAVSVVVNATYLVLLTQAFKWIKGQDDEDETFIESMLNELLGHFIGMFPIVRDAYSMLEGYDVQNMYETGLTNVARALQDMYQLVDVVVNDKAEDTKTMMAAFRRTLLGLSQTFGVPVRNIETYTKGIIEKFNESAIYKYEDIFFEQSYVKDLQKAIENGDDKMITTVVDAMFNSKNTEFTSKEIVKEVSKLTVAGYSIKPYTAPMEIMVDDEVVKLTGTQYRKFKSIYGQADDQVEALLNNRNYSRLDDEQKAKAIRMLYNYYYNLAKEEVTGESFTGKLGLLMNGLNPDKVAVILAYSSDTSMKGLTRRQAVTYQMKNMGFSLQQRNAILEYLGYSV